MSHRPFDSIPPDAPCAPEILESIVGDLSADVAGELSPEEKRKHERQLAKHFAAAHLAIKLLVFRCGDAPDFPRTEPEGAQKQWIGEHLTRIIIIMSRDPRRRDYAQGVVATLRIIKAFVLAEVKSRQLAAG